MKIPKQEYTAEFKDLAAIANLEINQTNVSLTSLAQTGIEYSYQ